MACCAAIALVIGVLRSAWFRVVPGARPAEAGFAPPARRPLDAGPLVATAPPAATPSRGRRGTAGLLAGIAAGTLLYAVAVAALLATPATRALDGAWSLRATGLAVVAAAATLGSLRTRQDGADRSWALAGAAAAWTELGLVDMHVLGLFEFRTAPVLLDVLFHGSGLLVLAVLVPRLLRRHPSLHPSTKAASA